MKNRYMKRLTPEQQKAASGFQAMQPAEKLGYICHVRREFVTRLCVPLLTACGILIDSAPKMVDGRVLEPPRPEYPRRDQSGAVTGYTNVVPRDGGWMMKWARSMFEQEFVLSGKKIDSLAIILTSSVDRRKAHTFIDDLLAKADALGRCPSSLRSLTTRPREPVLIVPMRIYRSVQLSRCPPAARAGRVRDAEGRTAQEGHRRGDSPGRAGVRHQAQALDLVRIDRCWLSLLAGSDLESLAGSSPRPTAPITPSSSSSRSSWRSPRRRSSPRSSTSSMSRPPSTWR